MKTEGLTELLTQEELMDRLKIARATLYRWRKEGLPEVRIGRTIRFDLAAVTKWVAAHAVDMAAPTWDWSVWTWTPEERKPSGEIEPAFWYEEARCRNQSDAENIVGLFQKVRPWMPVRASQTKPTDPPAEAGTYPVQEEG